jgi:hypothetical protein
MKPATITATTDTSDWVADGADLTSISSRTVIIEATSTGTAAPTAH